MRKLGPHINPTNGAALSALEVCRDVVPVPLGQFGEIEPTAVMASPALCSEAENQYRIKALVSVHRTGPISEERSGFASRGIPHDSAISDNRKAARD